MHVKRWLARSAIVPALAVGLACGGGESTKPSPTPTAMTAVAGDAQTGVAGTAIGTPPAVKVVDQNGAAMAGVNVVFSVTAGGGSVDGGTATTDASGMASVTKWTLGTTAGVNTLKAQSGNLSVTFTATGTAGAASVLVKSSADSQTAVVGSAVAAAPSVTVKDANGNPVAGVVVSFVVTGGGGAVTSGTPPAFPGTTASMTSSATGVVTLASWKLGTTAGPNTLRVGSNGLPVVNFSATGTAGPATTVSVSPASVTLLPAFTEQLTAKLLDQYGNTATGAAFTYSTANGGVATASNAGVVSGVALGNTTITVSSGALSKAVPVSVARRADVPDGGAPFAVRVSSSGVLLVGEHGVNRVGRFNLPSITKADSIAVGDNPTDVNVSADGSKAYVTNQWDGTLGVINLATNALVSTVDVGGSPLRVAPSRDGSRIYVTTGGGMLVTLNAATLAVTGNLSLGGALNGIAVDPTQPFIYVTNTSGKLFKLSETTGQVTDSVSTGATAQEVVETADGTQLFVANESGASQWRSTSDLSLITTFSQAGAVFGAALAPDGTRIWATRPSTGEVLVIDVARRLVLGTVNGGIPRRVTFSPDGLTAIIGNEAGYVTFAQ